MAQRRAGVDASLEAVLREERVRLTAALVRVIGDWDLAEELVQDAAISALEHWPRDGVPDNPGAWLMTTARRRAVDRLRRQARYRERLALLTAEASRMDARTPTGGPMEADDRLRLIFTCCHPALSREAQVALTLRTIGGLDTPAVARAFLVPEATIAQRLVRAKRKIRDAAIPYRIPDLAELPPRLAQVLSVLYLVFNEGYLASVGEAAERRDLARDAEWLTSLLVSLMPDEAEPMGLLALMRLHLARADARFAGDGSLVLLALQDRARWDRVAIGEAEQLLQRALRMGRPGPYQLQAAIIAVHADAATYADTDWTEIVGLYDRLMLVQPSPVVALNRGLAVAELQGAAAGLAAIEPLADRLDSYHLFHASRGELLRRLGRGAEARDADRRALSLTSNPAEKRLLRQRIGQEAR
ncbi:MAG TPA: sigma-70 family RNA polymerase sigma factor [Candidatus Limnocylindria bacterium]|nr:sigma-70 family RNA polymerase sigma factor [Candidatus Limnocylindria bacterium]